MSRLPRKGDTNQRLWFDLDPWGRYLATGDQVSFLILPMYQANEARRAISRHGISVACSVSSQRRHCRSLSAEWQQVRLQIMHELTADAIGSVQFHPFKPLMMASSGSRAPPIETEDEESSSSESDSESDEDDSDEEAVQDTERPARKKTLRPRPLDDSLRIWSFA
jgi:hypothetical protein